MKSKIKGMGEEFLGEEVVIIGETRVSVVASQRKHKIPFVLRGTIDGEFVEGFFASTTLGGIEGKAGQIIMLMRNFS